MFLVSILLYQCCYLDCWYWWCLWMLSWYVGNIFFMFIFPYFHEHVVIVSGSHIRKRIMIIRTGVVVRDFITYLEVNSLAIIWTTVWDIVWNTVIVVCNGVRINCIDMVNRKVLNISWCIVLWYVLSISLHVLLYIQCSG